MAIIMKKNYNIILEKNEIEDSEIDYLHNKYIIDNMLSKNNSFEKEIIFNKKSDEYSNNKNKIIDKITKSKEYNNLYNSLYEYSSNYSSNEDYDDYSSSDYEEDNDIKKNIKEYDNYSNEIDIDDFDDYYINKNYKESDTKQYTRKSKAYIETKNNKEIPFEKRKHIKSSFFMNIGHLIGLSLRNKYHKEIDEQIIKALKNNELDRVLEAEKNGYFLGRKLGKRVLLNLYENMLESPSNLVEKLVQKDIMMSYDNLSIAILSKEGKDLLQNNNPEVNPHAKALYADLINKKEFLFANKELWLRQLKYKQEFLKEENPIFYHDNMLNICEKNELEFVKKTLQKYAKDEDVLTSISQSKLIENMILKLNIKLGNAINLESIVAEAPQVVKELYQSIQSIKFNDEDRKLLESNFKYDLDLVENKLPEALIKYISVDQEYRTTLKSSSGKNAEELLIETLENILITKKDLKVAINQQKLSELSITRRYTETLRGDAGKPSLFELKTAQQLKESGELLDNELPKALEQKANSGNMLKNKI